jgi:hypothetical protein
MMNFKNWLETTDWAITSEVPPEPGTTPIPPNNVRLFHYTQAEGTSADQKHQAAELLRRNGLDIKLAKGNNYGEPNVVWASRQMPSLQRVFAEFSIDTKDPRWGPYWRDGNVPGEQGDCFFTDSIRPEEIIAVHEPWHHHYNYMIKNGLIEDVKAGKFDHLLSSPEYGPAVKKIKAS